MRSHGRFSLPRRLAPLVLLCSGGCCLPEILGLAPGHPAALPPAQPAAAAPAAAPAVAGPPAAPLPLNLVPAESPQDQISLLSQKLDAVIDDRKVLEGRLLQVEATVQERERALAQATDEIGKAGDEIERSRAEVNRWKQEVLDLREKLRKLEKENMGNLETIIKMLEKLEQQKELTPVPPPEPDAGKAP
jgi:septal ring factor EnvC (AmiA/AmiB activator)